MASEIRYPRKTPEHGCTLSAVYDVQENLMFNCASHLQNDASPTKEGAKVERVFTLLRNLELNGTGETVTYQNVLSMHAWGEVS